MTRDLPVGVGGFVLMPRHVRPHWIFDALIVFAILALIATCSHGIPT